MCICACVCGYVCMCVCVYVCVCVCVWSAWTCHSFNNISASQIHFSGLSHKWSEYQKDWCGNILSMKCLQYLSPEHQMTCNPRRLPPVSGGVQSGWWEVCRVDGGRGGWRVEGGWREGCRVGRGRAGGRVGRVVSNNINTSSCLLRCVCRTRYDRKIRETFLMNIITCNGWTPYIWRY